MLSQAERNQIIDLINREVVPAIGCTEPIAVALCTARAAETLGGEPEKITVRLSANILKNAMGVGIPGTGMIGLPIAVALGALVGRSEYQLEVLRDKLLFADDVALTQADASNMKVLISAPFMNGVVATHLPFMGEKGADFLLEQIQGYYQK